MIEPAAYGVAVCFGPNTQNFRDVVDMLLDREAVVRVSSGEELTAFVGRCLEENSADNANSTFAADLGRRAAALVRDQQGAIERTWSHLVPLLPPAGQILPRDSAVVEPVISRPQTRLPSQAASVKPEIDSGIALCKSTRWWREWEFWALALLAAAIYFSRMVDLPIRGEETRRAMVAWEILQTGDWIVPRQQGQPFLSRPPVGSWPIAWITAATGDLSLIAVRLPTILATLLTTLLVYSYSRQFLSRLGALGSGLTFATFVQVLQLGRVAETEATFTLFAAGAMILWHWGYSRRWPAWQTWCAAYTLVAIAALIKSLQAPVYFCGAVGLFLLWRRDWRYLFSRAHLAGLITFAVVLGAWQFPFYEKLGWTAVRSVWSGDVGLRFEEISPGIIAAHLATYPIEVLACLLPWSLLSPAYLWPQFRKTIGSAGPLVAFAVCAWLVALPTCWFVPNAKPRYLMPVYPLAAPLVGLVIQRVFEAGAQSVAMVRLGWRMFLGGAIASIAVGAAVVAFVSWFGVPHVTQLAQPAWFAGIYLTAAVATVVILLRGRNNWSPKTGAIAVVTLSAFLGLTVSGVAVNSTMSTDPHSDSQVAQLKQRLPADAHLVSFGQVETIFSYYWRDKIDVVNQHLPTRAGDLPSDCNYFCFNSNNDKSPRLPFPWRVEATINCDRTNDDPVGKVVIVGRRVDAVTLLPDETTNRR